ARAMAFHMLGENNNAVEAAKQGMVFLVREVGEQALGISDLGMLNYFEFILRKPSEDSSYMYVDMTQELKYALTTLEKAEQFPKFLTIRGPTEYAFAIQQIYLESVANFYAEKYEQAEILVKKAIRLVSESLPEDIGTRPVSPSIKNEEVRRYAKISNEAFGEIRKALIAVLNELNSDITAKLQGQQINK
ncbi:MAG: hypothetical protein V1909_01420, partial [Candidatus Micrarchaeota archaeon]